MKYTKEQTQELIEAYTQCTNQEQHLAVVDAYASKFGKSKTSVIAKLSKAKVYVKYDTVSKITKGRPKTRLQIKEELEDITGVNLQGLEIAPKLTLLRLLEYEKGEE